MGWAGAGQAEGRRPGRAGRSLCSGLAPLRSGLLPAPGLATRPHGYMTSSIPARRPPPAALRGASPHHGQQGKGSWPPDFSPALSFSSSCAQEPHFCFANSRPQSTFRRETLPLSRELPRAQRDPSAASAAASVCFCLRPRLALAVALLAVTQVSPAGEAPAPFTAHTTAIDRPGVRVQLHRDRPEGDADLNVHPHEEVQTVPEDGRPRGQTAAPPTARRLLWGPKFIWKHLDIRFGRGPRS